MDSAIFLITVCEQEKKKMFSLKKHYSWAVLIQLQRACRLFVRVAVKFRVRVRVSVRARFTFRVWVRVRVRARARARVGVGFSSYSPPPTFSPGNCSFSKVCEGIGCCR